MHPEDAKDWEKFGTFVHHFEGGGPFLDGDGKPLDLSSYMPKTKKKASAKKAR